MHEVRWTQKYLQVAHCCNPETRVVFPRRRRSSFTPSACRSFPAKKKPLGEFHGWRIQATRALLGKCPVYNYVAQHGCETPQMWRLGNDSGRPGRRAPGR